MKNWDIIIIILLCVFILVPMFIRDYRRWKKTRRDNIRLKKELKELRNELKKPNPDGDKIFRLLCGDKYTEPLIKRK